MNTIALSGLQNLLIVGEYTTPACPDLDDYFLVLVDRSGAMTEVPMGEALALIPALEKTLQAPLVFRLNNSTDFKSRVLYPPELEGRPLLDFTMRSGIRAALDTIRDFGWKEFEIKLSDDVNRYVQRSHP